MTACCFGQTWFWSNGFPWKSSFICNDFTFREIFYYYIIEKLFFQLTLIKIIIVFSTILLCFLCRAFFLFSDWFSMFSKEISKVFGAFFIDKPNLASYNWAKMPRSYIYSVLRDKDRIKWTLDKRIILNFCFIENAFWLAFFNLGLSEPLP